MEKRYNVIYTGKIHPDATQSDVVDKVSSLFKISKEKAGLFVTSQKPRIIKKDIPLDIAKKYKNKLIRIGLKIDLKKISHKPSSQSISTNTIKSHKNDAKLKPSKLYSPRQIAFGTFFGGPLAATYFLKNNFDTLDKENYSKKTIIIGLTVSIVLIALMPFIPEGHPSVTINLTLLYLFPVMFVVKRHQLTKEEILESFEYSFQSNWKVLGMISVWLAVYFAVAVLFMFVLELAGITHVLD
jgi:hypothetical protein